MSEDAAPQGPAEQLTRLRLKCLVKESHGQSVLRLSFNRVDSDKQHLFVTVGGAQATVYDNEHFVRYISVVEQFANCATEHSTGGDLLTCCWLPSAAQTAHVHGDALLAVGGKDSCVSVISLASCAVVRLLKGHTQPVVDVAATASRPRLVASVARDGMAKIWDFLDGTCVHTIPVADATCVAWAETGNTLFVGTSHGSVVACAVPGQLPTRGSADGVTTPLPAGHGQCRVDCLCPLAQHRIATKSSDGKCCVWDVSEAGAPKLVTSFKEPGATKAAGSQVGCTPDGTVLLVGGSAGDVTAWSTANGTKLGTLHGGKNRAAVCAVAATQGCANVLVAYTNGSFVRWEEVLVPTVPMTDDADDAE